MDLSSEHPGKDKPFTGSVLQALGLLLLFSSSGVNVSHLPSGSVAACSPVSAGFLLNTMKISVSNSVSLFHACLESCARAGLRPASCMVSS